MTAHERLVKHTALFIQRYSDIILNNLDKGTMSYSYTKNNSSLIKFMSLDYTSYTFELFSSDLSDNDKFIPSEIRYELKLTVTGPEQDENTIYKSIKKVIPFVNVNYKRVFEIFDFLQKDDQLLGTIQSFKRFNSMTTDFKAVFNGVKVVHEIKYENFYKKIYKRKKLNNETLTHLFFDNDLNISTGYTVVLDFSPNSFSEICFSDLDESYYVSEKSNFFTKDELFEYIKSSRRDFIEYRINKLFKNIEFEIDFDNNFKDQIHILEMLTI